jgi:hypothetical protein
MKNNNMWDCADLPPMFSAKIDDSSGFFFHIFLNGFWYVLSRPKYFGRQCDINDIQL